MLYSILHSSVALFACLIAILVLRTPVTPTQLTGAAMVGVGVLITALPHPVPARRSFALGAIASALGSLFLAASYPLAELVFVLARAPPEECVAFYGSLLNVLLYSLWTLLYTAPRWRQLVIEPMYDPDVVAPSVRWAVFSYALHASLVGLHTLAFFKSVRKLGAVPTAISKGVQQAGNFICAHIFFCRVDVHECIWHNAHRGSTTQLAAWRTWSQWQKPLAILVCCAGVVIYMLDKRTRVVLVTGVARERGGYEQI